MVRFINRGGGIKSNAMLGPKHYCTLTIGVSVIIFCYTHIIHLDLKIQNIKISKFTIL